MQSKVYRGGKEEATQAYSNIRRGADDVANKGRRMNANWYKLFFINCHIGQLIGMAVVETRDVFHYNRIERSQQIADFFH